MGLLLRTLLRVAMLLVGPVAVLLASDLAGAAMQQDWVLTQRMNLNGHSAAQCYDMDESGSMTCDLPTDA